MCDEGAEKDLKMLIFFPYYFKTQEMCEKAVSCYLHALEYAFDCYMTQEICEKAVDT